MPKKLVMSFLVVCMLLATSASFVAAASEKQTYDSQLSLMPQAAGTQCRLNTWSTTGYNIWGMRLYTFNYQVHWCYDGNKAWTDWQNAWASDMGTPGISYKGVTKTVNGNNTRYFVTRGTGTFHSNFGIPTPWGTFGWNQEVHPWVAITGYYYGNVGVSLSNH